MTGSRDVLYRAAHDPDPGVCAAAVQVIATAWPDDPDTRSLLWQAVRDDFGSVRAVAVAAIAQVLPEHPRTVALLHTAALNDDDGDVRATAVRTIAQVLPGHRDTARLLHLAARDDDRNMHSSVRMVWAFHDNSDRGARRRPVRVGYRSVRATAVAAIAEVFPEHPRTVALLHTALHDDDGYVRATAVRTIAQAFPGHPDTARLLHLATRDGDDGVAGSAMAAIAWRFPDHEDTLAMLDDRAANAPPHSYARYTAQDLITLREYGHRPGPPAEADLAMFWDGATYAEDDMYLFGWVPRAIRQVWRLTLADLHDMAVTGAEPAVRAAAVERIASGWPDHSDTFPLLRRAAGDPHERVRVVAVQGLGRVLLHESGRPAGGNDAEGWSRPYPWQRDDTGKIFGL